MGTHRYLHYDVFTDTRFEGNQLAVFPEPAGLTADDMLRIAREMNFSESTFLFPAEAAGTDVRMRIFTPGEELPIAGHPTIGTTFALVQEQRITPGQAQFVFGLGVGPTPVSLEWKGNALDFAWMTLPLPTFGPEVGDRDAFARSLGLKTGDLAKGPVQPVSCGNLFLFVPLASRAAVDRVSIDRAAYAACLQTAGLNELPVFILTLDRAGARGDETVYSRMLAPGFGIAEDPATGSASGPLGAYLFRHGLVPRDRLTQFVSLQGVKMLRPSRIHVSIDARGDEITRVRVGGRSVLVGEGRITIDSH
jgi:trans-2,3-dihydro-3-hydroxyanthranilate isomerase